MDIWYLVLNDKGKWKEQQELESAKPHGEKWGYPCLGRAPFAGTELRKKFPSTWRGPGDEDLSHLPHYTETTLLLSQKAWLCILVWCQLSRTISSCSGQGLSFCKGEKLAQPTYIIVPLDSSRPCPCMRGLQLYLPQCLQWGAVYPESSEISHHGSF